MIDGPSAGGRLDPNTKTAIDDAFDVTYSFPASVEVRLVEASGLMDYEVWLFISSLLSNFVVGFLTASVADKHDRTILVIVTVIFGLMFLASVAMTLFRRRRLGKKTRRFKGQIGTLTPEGVGDDSLS